MANVAKGYGVGDTVWVAYPLGSSLFFTPQSRVVRNVNILDGTNEATVTFTNGAAVLDGAVVTVFTTEALAATAIVNTTITLVSAAVTLDVTTSAASTAAQVSGDLVRGS